jgi:hypothetical protein
MRNKFIEQEEKTILCLDNVLNQKSMGTMIDAIVKRVGRKLLGDSRSDLAWEPVPLDAYKTK